MKTIRRYKKRRTLKRALKQKGGWDGYTYSQIEKEEDVKKLRSVDQKSVDDMYDKLHRYKDSLLYGHSFGNEKEIEILLKQELWGFIANFLKASLIEEMFKHPLNNDGKLIVFKLLSTKNSNFGYATKTTIDKKETEIERLIKLDKPIDENPEPRLLRLELKYYINEWIKLQPDNMLSDFGKEMKRYFNQHNRDSYFMQEPRRIIAEREAEIARKKAEIARQKKEAHKKFAKDNPYINGKIQIVKGLFGISDD